MSDPFITALRRGPFGVLGPVTIAKAIDPIQFTDGNEFDTRTTALVRLEIRFTGIDAASQLLLTWDFQDATKTWVPATMRNTAIVLLSTLAPFAGVPGFMNDVAPVFLRFPAGAGLQTFEVADFNTLGTRAIRFRASDLQPGALVAAGMCQIILTEQLGG